MYITIYELFFSVVRFLLIKCTRYCYWCGLLAGCCSLNYVNYFLFVESRLLTINDFLFDTHLDNLNLFKISKYCKRSFISQKVAVA